ncbi:DUF2071 domain-containing protein [Puniceicoccus vermicola]|uniref:DUF2071 domain-containing protein n=1 Tax=Puniceicoccus vermicola TaxID=388746 RepID=A0A7X1B192_9BACT|nr:DUF2071 domain-containing protein [Puniceicoccus vermicola]MBC2603692.1 DUF2071 domain-containing protein [Puniceicoccus vermicola]
MRIPKITGIIKRRFLINFRIEPEVMSRVLPKPFCPKLHNGYAVGGICLIRLEGIKPAVFPLPWGFSSENAAHRVAVTWEGNEGVYIPRRDSDSRVSQLAGGRIFPGVHYPATFDVRDSEGYFDFKMKSKDSHTTVSFSGRVSDTFPESSCFSSLQESSDFFESGSLGYSAKKSGSKYDGLRLETESWTVSPFEIENLESSFFNDARNFPEGSIEYDHTLFMQNIKHHWHHEDDLCCQTR